MLRSSKWKARCLTCKACCWLGTSPPLLFAFARTHVQCSGLECWGWRGLVGWNSQWNSAQQGGMTAQQVQGRRGDHIVSPPTSLPCSGAMQWRNWGEIPGVNPTYFHTLWTLCGHRPRFWARGQGPCLQLLFSPDLPSLCSKLLWNLCLFTFFTPSLPFSAKCSFSFWIHVFALFSFLANISYATTGEWREGRYLPIVPSTDCPV